MSHNARCFAKLICELGLIRKKIIIKDYFVHFAW
jgi:hypothetical protein